MLDNACNFTGQYLICLQCNFQMIENPDSKYYVINLKIVSLTVRLGQIRRKKSFFKESQI